jgi:hypothetical protein
MKPYIVCFTGHPRPPVQPVQVRVVTEPIPPASVAVHSTVIGTVRIIVLVQGTEPLSIVESQTVPYNRVQINVIDVKMMINISYNRV